MSQNKIAKGIRGRLKSEFTACQKRAYVMTSKGAYFWKKSYKTPGCIVIYRGGPVKGGKGTSKRECEHKFDIFLVQGIWDEDKVCTGGPGKPGALELQEQTAILFHRYKFENELPDVHIITAEHTFNYGTEDFPDLKLPDGFSCVTGIQMTYHTYE